MELFPLALAISQWELLIAERYFFFGFSDQSMELFPLALAISQWSS
jgi:hypothetical protein